MELYLHSSIHLHGVVLSLKKAHGQLYLLPLPLGLTETYNVYLSIFFFILMYI